MGVCFPGLSVVCIWVAWGNCQSVGEGSGCPIPWWCCIWINSFMFRARVLSYLLDRGFGSAFVCGLWMWWGFVGCWLFLHVSGSLCITVFVIGNLLSLIAQRLMASSACSLMGGIDASISMAVIGDVLKTAQISLRAHLCTFSSGLI